MKSPSSNNTPNTKVQSLKRKTSSGELDLLHFPILPYIHSVIVENERTLETLHRKEKVLLYLYAHSFYHLTDDHKVSHQEDSMLEDCNGAIHLGWLDSLDSISSCKFNLFSYGQLAAWLTYIQTRILPEMNLKQPRLSEIQLLIYTPTSQLMTH